MKFLFTYESNVIAVVLTLLYLARQLTEHTKRLQVQSLESSFAEWNGTIHEM